jgi:mono/diheme cytochrome c family protein
MQHLVRLIFRGVGGRIGVVIACAVIVIVGGAAAESLAAVPEKVTFNDHVRPILSGNCFYCHGPDPKHREADLRLDTREGATADLGGYAAIVPGKPEESALLKRVLSTDPEERMPPPASKKPHLSDEQIATLRKWIAEGAEYQGHWAFLPLAHPEPPAVRQQAIVENAIDRFILARLEKEGISPSAEADRATLIRRVSLDLTGLLPSPEELAAFVADQRPTAYEALVDRLLASPHYGERWGRHWLDQARYADSNGYTIDSERPMWPYRDWVIKALNDNMPFDQFTVEQLAGDLIPSATKSQLVATAFHRNTLINEEGGTDKEQFRHEAVVDRVNTTGAVWLGLTIGCCQCHTHKFDPIQHREYYELFAFFNNGTDINNQGATIPVTRGELFGRPVAKPPTDSEPAAQLAKRQAAWEARELARVEGAGPEKVSWTPLEYVEYGTRSGATFQLLNDNSLLTDGKAAPQDRYQILARTKLQEIEAVRLRVLTHESLPKTGPGTAGNGNFILTDINLITSGQKRPFVIAFADHEQPNFPIKGAIDEDGKTGWAINVGPGAKGKLNANHEAVFILEKPIFVPPGDAIEIMLSHEANNNYLIGRFAIDVAADAPAEPSMHDAAVVEALTTAAEKRTAEQKKTLADAFAKSEGQLQTRKKEDPRGDTVRLMVMKELDQPRETFICQRGDFLRPDKEAGPLAPDVLDAIPPKLADTQGRSASEGPTPTRLDLARWLVDPQNPLTPRVQMNRVWMRYFGRGLVETEEDFGTQGTPPSHPELLDWLAGELIRQNWSLKAMHRLIVTSHTYRQASTFRSDLKDKDPRNLLLARQERVRVEAEVVRDAALTASGLLDRTLGGPSVRPPQPDGVYAFTQTAKKWTPDTGTARYRRAMYTLFFRSAPHPLFSTFDAPDFQTVCTRRGRSNTPLQALTVANDEAFIELAQGLAARVLREAPAETIDDQIRRAFQLALSREPSAAEVSALHDYYQRQLTDLSDDQERARKLLAAGLVPGDAPPADAAALVLVSRAILNTDSFITRE